MPALTKLPVFFVLCSFCFPLSAATLTYGSEVEVRLTHQVGSRLSHVGDTVQATVISPVFDHDTLILAAGSAISGTVDHVEALGLGLRHTSARLDIHFTKLQLPDGTFLPIDARIASVETARETVRTDGSVMGINPTANFSTGVSAAFTLANLAEREFRLPVLAFKLLAARSPDAEILFPAGTEMLVRITKNIEMRPTSNHDSEVAPLSAAQITAVQNVLAAVPQQQTNRGGGNHPSDLVNLMIIGDKETVARTFHAAGWTAPESHGVLAFYHMFHCAVERKSSGRLPMSNLKLNGYVPDMAFEKGLDTFSKRHHIRLWRDAQTGAWLAAATEDIGYKMLHAHVTHATDRKIDNERAKVVNDLAFTGCISHGALIPRDSLKPAQDAGSSIITDGDIAVLQLNSCETPTSMPTDPHKPTPVRAIRVVMALGIDLARSNPISVGYALTKSILEAGDVRKNQQLQASRAYNRPSAVANASFVKADGSLAERR